MPVAVWHSLNSFTSRNWMGPVIPDRYAANFPSGVTAKLSYTEATGSLPFLFRSRVRVSSPVSKSQTRSDPGVVPCRDAT